MSLPKRGCPDKAALNALLVFAKAPVPGRVKTRLTPAISPADAASLYRAFLADAADQYAGLDCAVRYYIAPKPDGAVGEAAGLVPRRQGATLHSQHGDGLGERMLNAFVDTFRSGFERIVVIGSDHPTLPTEFVAHAFDELESSSTVVLGPTVDGGYYLLGLSELYPTLFEGMRFSHDAVFEDTLGRLGNLDARLAVLPEWSDVDTADELISLYRSFWPGAMNGEQAMGGEQTAAAEARRNHAPHTAKEVQRLARHYSWIREGISPR